MRARVFVALGVAAYLVSLAATLPASLVTPRIEGWTQGSVTLSNPAGRVFAGSATARLRLPGLTPITLERVEWDWQALALFRGQLAVSLRAGTSGLTATAEFARSPMAWHVRNASADGPASALSSFHSLLGAWNPAGRVALSVPSLRIDGAGFIGSGAVEWREAALALSPAQPLGSWRLALTGEGGPAKLTLSTQRGPLSLTGSGTISPGGKAAFSGEAKAEAGREADLATLLATIGPRRADGVHAFNLP